MMFKHHAVVAPPCTTRDGIHKYEFEFRLAGDEKGGGGSPLLDTFHGKHVSCSYTLKAEVQQSGLRNLLQSDTLACAEEVIVESFPCAAPEGQGGGRPCCCSPWASRSRSSR